MKRFSEISKGLAGRYLKKVPASAADAADTVARSAGKYGDKNLQKKGIKNFVNRNKGTAMAVDKLTGKAKVPAKEAVEEGNQRHIDNLKDVIARHQKAHDHHQQMGKEADNRGDAVKHMNSQQAHAKALKHAKERLAKLQNEETSMEEKTLSQKDIQKGLAKAARTAKSKDQVTLPKAPWDKEKKNEAVEKVAEISQDKLRQYHAKAGADLQAKRDKVTKGELSMADLKKGQNRVKGLNRSANKMEAVEKEELKGAQHKLDHDKDGKITANDFKGLRKKKEKQETGNVNPKLDNGKSKGNEMEQKESTSIRQRLMSIWEKADAHMKGATPSEPHGQYDSPGGKKMKQDMKADGNPEVGINGKDVEELGHDDASKAGRAGPNAAKRPNDAKVGDKQIINRVAAAYKEMKSGN